MDASPLRRVSTKHFILIGVGAFLLELWAPPASACTPGSRQLCSRDDCRPAYRECIDASPPYWGPCDCEDPPVVHYTYNGTSCGCITGRWDAPRGSLVLIDSGPGSAIKPIINEIGETYTHEMIVQSADTAAQSDYRGPDTQDDCDHPLEPTSLALGFPGMEKSMNLGAIYADIYGSGSIAFSPGGSAAVIWLLGDPDRANAIADALDQRPAVDVLVHSGEYIHRTIRNGDVSPYGLYQYMNIEGTYLGEGGTSLNNASASSTFCAYAYALGGDPMTSFDYAHDETVNAANAFWQSVYNQCRAGFPWWGIFFGCPSSIGCNHAAAMVLNCMATADCTQNNNFFWQSALTPPDSHASSISPDRLGGLTRFINEVPRPTTWATDTAHWVQWNIAGEVCGCFD